jgi:ABC-2 type transport system ATP-binding protein
MTPPDHPDAPAISLRDLVAVRGSFRLDIPRLDLPRGCVVGLVGANGAGKSTLMRLLPGLDTRTSGSVKVLGRDPETDPVGVRTRMGWMSDDMPVFDLRIDRLLTRLSALYPTWDLDLVRRLVDQLGLDLRKLPSDLSKGEGTRLRLVLALAFRPDVVVLDEPATGLDVAGRRALLAAVLDVSQDPQRTVLISSHALSDVERIADRLVVLHRGSVLHEGVTDSLITPGKTLEEQLLAWWAC